MSLLILLLNPKLNKPSYQCHYFIHLPQMVSPQPDQKKFEMKMVAIFEQCMLSNVVHNIKNGGICILIFAAYRIISSIHCHLRTQASVFDGPIDYMYQNNISSPVLLE